MAKVFVFFFAQAVLLQCALSQCSGRAAYAPAFAAPCGSSLAAPAYSPLAISPTSGGALPVISASAVAPDAIVVNSENTFGGILAVAGDLPFVGTVGVDGVLPTAGSGAVSHACGGPARMNSVNSGYSSSAAVASNPGIGAYQGAGLNAAGLNAAGLNAAGLNAAGLNAAALNAASLAGANIGAGYYGAGLGLAEPGYGYGLGGYAGNPGLRVPGSYPVGSAGGLGYYGESLAPYGGSGEGNVAVAGELPVAGETVVVGQVPIMGAVEFVGPVPAYGTVTINGFCSCGCL